MPLYLYENQTTGEILEQWREIYNRDKCPPGCVRVMPDRISVVDGQLPEHDPDVQVPKTLRQAELAANAAHVERETGFTAKELKSIWNMK